jgi:hypothetical protein
MYHDAVRHALADARRSDLVCEAEQFRRARQARGSRPATRNSWVGRLRLRPRRSPAFDRRVGRPADQPL